MLSRKHYKDLAAVIEDRLGQCQAGGEEILIRDTAHDLAAFCREHGQNFNSARFFLACGLTSEGELP